MPHNDLIGLGLYLGYIAATGIPAILLKVCFKVPFEIIRKVYHLVVTLSIFPLVTVFGTWYAAVGAVLLFAVVLYPILARVEKSPAYRRIAVERKEGEFKSSLIIVQVMMALLLTLFWGMMGEEWKYVAVVAVMGWGLGDAAAALVGKAIGKRRVRHPRVQGPKTYEGTLAMYVTACLAMFTTMVVYAGQPWPVSLAVALLVAPVCAVVELFSSGGMDTITVPVSTGLAVLSCQLLLTLMGV